MLIVSQSKQTTLGYWRGGTVVVDPFLEASSLSSNEQQQV
jgi:hypothetical protein